MTKNQIGDKARNMPNTTENFLSSKAASHIP